MIPEVNPEQLVEMRAHMDGLVLVDVRDAHEREISVLEGDLHLPMTELPERVHELDSSAPTVIYCRTGARSGQVVAYLKELGFSDVYNLAGGINRFAEDVDPTLTTY